MFLHFLLEFHIKNLQEKGKNKLELDRSKEKQVNILAYNENNPRQRRQNLMRVECNN